MVSDPDDEKEEVTQSVGRSYECRSAFELTPRHLFSSAPSSEQLICLIQIDEFARHLLPYQVCWDSLLYNCQLMTMLIACVIDSA